MLEPQSTALFVLLVVIFGGLMWPTIFARHTAIRVLAACLAFMPAMLFGVLAVNKYYGYYQTWGAVVADMTNRGVSAASRVPDITLTSGSRSGTLDGSHAHLRQAQQQGYMLRLMVTGPRSRITRAVYVYLPPQYFQPGYQAYRFPVIELIHGQPGQPEDWISVVGVTNTFDHLLQEGLARPAVRGHAGRERQYEDLAAVPQPGGRPAGPDLPGGGPAGADRAHPAGAAAGLGLGRGRLLRGRVLRRQHGPALPAPLRFRRGAQRLLRAARQPAGRTAPPGQPVRRQPQAAAGEHAA